MRGGLGPVHACSLVGGSDPEMLEGQGLLTPLIFLWGSYPLEAAILSPILTGLFCMPLMLK